MSHKFHKVYPDHANTPPKTTTSIIRTINQIEAMTQSTGPSTLERVREWLGTNWFALGSVLVNLITVGVLILTWVAYLRANELNQASLAAAHTPWLTLTAAGAEPNPQPAPFTYDSKFIYMNFRIVNESDSPAFGTVVKAEVFGNLIGPENTSLDKFGPPDPGGIVMPHENNLITVPCSFSNPEEVFNEIQEGKYSWVIRVWYKDFQNNPYLLKETFRMIAPNKVAILKSEIKKIP